MHLIKDIILLFLLSSFPACFSYLLDYIIGQPGIEQPNSNAILFCYTLKLSMMRLKKVKQNGVSLLHNTWEGFNETSKRFAGDDVAFNNLQSNYKLSLVTQANQFFKWERAFGMCIYCTNVWICFFFGLAVMYYSNDFIVPKIFIPLVITFFSHTILRKIIN